MNIYEKRWEAAKQLILDIKKMCKDNDISHVEYDGERYHIDNLIVHENVEIAEKIYHGLVDKKHNRRKFNVIKGDY